MDVRCQQCGVEYEFDDERITPQGVTVKCSSCGHIFKVKREVRVVTEAVAEAPPISGDWMVRQPSGNVFTFKELTTLQRWIVERKVARDDEISRTGKTWKRLGDIAELASFFQVVDDATGRSFTDVQGLMAVQQPMNPALYGGMQVLGTASALPAAVAPQPGAPVIAAPVPQPVPHGALVVPAPVVPMASAPPPAAPAALPGAVPVAAPVVAQPSLPPLAAVGDEDALLDDEDPVRAWRRRRRWPLALMALVLIAAGALIGLRLFARPTFDAILARAGALVTPAPPPEVLAASDAAAAAVLRDVEDDLASAIETSKRAIAAAPDRAEPYAALALAETGLAEALDARYRATRQAYEALLKRFPDGLADDQPEKREAQELADRASRLGDEAQQHFKRAADAVNEALAIAREAPLTALAAADYNRAVGTIDEAQRFLRSLPAEVQAQALPASTAALLELGEGAPTAAAVAALQELLQRHPGAVRVRYRLALAQAQLDQAEAATTNMRAVLDAAPGHLRAADWLAARTAPAPASAPAVVDKTPAPPPATTAPGPAPAAADGEVPGASFDSLMTQADRLRDQGKVARAFSLYTRAASLQPERAEPRSGMGWCYVEQGKGAAAIASFQAALEANPGYAEAHMGLAESYRARGTTDKALLHYQRYLEILPSGPDASVAQHWIAELSAK